ncbi:type I-E CRISPR-associated protein Cas5/CasD [Trinickia caryophylli]|uniref:CRISPR system Cascade subunit CasD n=1 Tax=Trinickia caryophylli TaxID=28094 RepID=A0A1X7FS54_TRICW|nr:type I-E CRISPR-associated protein Cas5/CasD [Trinickia caryophylli]PMS11964.1 type I-E CRISPR-associated protein Cas5/CasD [Trinickia caryophylli]TRX13956.1 type I-E CRISPR-associated protein Cas5/CasD [Trinickia caryophylli]WQE15554.1 type I-E CRISPR-associated protein Cas5/CasD [Trinickia caryophylli]SMF57806.1 CRISPR system Cascade subunit CasD [Trinickia caryophylli]GLU33695.1 type I-E CRISPR-associated protein Cas5/CasD [Trinickia caryophylli]
MREYMVFQLYGPMAGWGELAVGEQRACADHPSRSALLGMIGAALGVCRDDDAGQEVLSRGYRFGVKLIAAGMPLRDYHTVQWPEVSKKVAYRTRRQELRDMRKLNTILTSRDYRSDSFSVVAAEAAPDAPYSLPALAAALRAPVFVPYLGRKSCPLALPMDPRVVCFDTLKQALDSRDGDSPLLGCGAVRRDQQTRYFWDEAMTAPGMEPMLQLIRHDQPLSRRRWQFEPRRELVYLTGSTQ